MYWRFITILCLVMSLLLGYLLFAGHADMPIGAHALFLVLVGLFLYSLLQVIRARLEEWLDNNDAGHDMSVREHSNTRHNSMHRDDASASDHTRDT